MATIKERRAKAARKRIDKGRKPFTNTKPAAKKRRAPSKGLPKRGKIPIRVKPGTVTFQTGLDSIIREINGRSRQKVKKTRDDGPVTSL